MHHMQQQAAQQHHQQQQQQQQRQRQQGVDAARFESMLQFARSERPAIAGNAGKQQQLELRKEVAFKAHQTRQAERRRLFLSKIVALPSPTATATPVTPPESPAVFHFTLPSPGLVSPLALFETLEYDPSTADVRIEHVDFRARAKRDADATAAITRNVRQSMEINGLSYDFPSPGRKQRQPTSAALPSLAQISARLNATNIVTTNRAPAANGASRLPAFLRKSDTVASPVSPPSPAPAAKTTAAATPASRLPAFLRTREQKRSPASSSGSSDTVRPAAMPRSPRSPLPPVLSVTPPDAPLPSPTPSIAIFGPTDPPSTTYPSDDVVVLDQRARHAKDMFDKLRRRVSAPAELTSRKDSHPILKVRGGF
jgi:hypothetical protein